MIWMPINLFRCLPMLIKSRTLTWHFHVMLPMVKLWLCIKINWRNIIRARPGSFGNSGQLPPGQMPSKVDPAMREHLEELMRNSPGNRSNGA